MLVNDIGSVMAVVNGRTCMDRFASAILAFICEKLSPLYVRLLACEFWTGVPIGVCAGFGKGVGDFIGCTAGIEFVTTTRPGAGAGAFDCEKVVTTQVAETKRPIQMLFFIVNCLERSPGNVRFRGD